jgi:hypothetical protein
MERENKVPTFNDAVFAILPLLKNGVTPERQTILSILEDIAERVVEDGWKLKQKGQGEFSLYRLLKIQFVLLELFITGALVYERVLNRLKPCSGTRLRTCRNGCTQER